MLNLEQTIDREWLQGRFLVLELASLLDRLDAVAACELDCRAEDRRIAVLRKALQELPRASESRSRCERILNIYCDLAASNG